MPSQYAWIYECPESKVHNIIQAWELRNAYVTPAPGLETSGAGFAGVQKWLKVIKNTGFRPAPE
jgi:hypothetical protein